MNTRGFSLNSKQSDRRERLLHIVHKPGKSVSPGTLGTPKQGSAQQRSRRVWLPCGIVSRRRRLWNSRFFLFNFLHTSRHPRLVLFERFLEFMNNPWAFKHFAEGISPLFVMNGVANMIRHLGLEGVELEINGRHMIVEVHLVWC